jgi:hypothetical protein
MFRKRPITHSQLIMAYFLILALVSGNINFHQAVDALRLLAGVTLKRRK